MSYSKVIELILNDGTPNGITIAELSNWNGKAIKIPRKDVEDCNRSDIKQPGIYFLFCKDDGEEKDSVYIGESENVKKRLTQHIRDYNSEKEKYYWHTALIITSDKLTKTMIRYLEYQFVDICKICNRYKCLTKNRHQNTVLTEAQESTTEEFIDNVKILISTLGFKVFEPLVETDFKTGSVKSKILYLETIGGAKGIGTKSPEGFVLLKGSIINDGIVGSAPDYVRKLREQYQIEGKIRNNKTTEDILFTSPSSAGSFVTGNSISGPLNWKDENGISLKDIEEKKINNSEKNNKYSNITNKIEKINQEPKITDEKDFLYIKTKNNVSARGYKCIDSFIVYKGSKISPTVKKSLEKNIFELRIKYEENGKIQNHILQEDIEFTSPSAAAKFVTGYSINGWTAWKDIEGRDLNHLERRHK